MTAESYDYYLRMLKLPRNAHERDVRTAVTKELRVWTQRTNSPRLEQRQEAERMIATFETAEKVLLGPEGQVIRHQREGSAIEDSSQYQDISVDAETVARAIERLALARGRKAQERQRTVLAKRATTFHNGVEYVYEEFVHKSYEAAQDSKNCRANQSGLILFDWNGISMGNGQQGNVRTYVQGSWVTDLIGTAASIDST